MTTTASGELTAANVIGLIESGAYPRDSVVTIARGFLPLSQEDLITVLLHLADGSDEELATLARTTLISEVPLRARFEFASNEQIAPQSLLRLLQRDTDGLVLEALIRNRAVSDQAIVELARTADERLQEVIVINQARIIRAPEILEALLANPDLSADTRRRALETKEEFFEKKARLQAIEESYEDEPELVDAPLDAIADLLEKAAEMGDQVTPPAPLADGERSDPKKASLWAQLNFMTVSEKVQLAYRGDRMTRLVLVRERNKLISGAVMRNPRMTEREAESIATMRNVDEEVLRILGSRRDWMSKYNIMVALCRNPKTPIGVVLPLINRLTLRDLKGLKDDKGCQQVVREMARKAYILRTQKS